MPWTCPITFFSNYCRKGTMFEISVNNVYSIFCLRSNYELKRYEAVGVAFVLGNFLQILRLRVFCVSGFITFCVSNYLVFFVEPNELLICISTFFNAKLLLWGLKLNVFELKTGVIVRLQLERKRTIYVCTVPW